MPTRMGVAIPASCASRAACSETSSWNATASFFRPRFFASSSNWSNVLISMEPPLLVRLFCLKIFFEAHICLVESLQFILPRHDLDGSDEAHPISHPLHEHVIMSQPACQHDDIHVTLKHCGHATDLLRDLICHAFIDQPGFGVSRINTATHLPRITRSKMGDQSPLLRHLAQDALFRRSGRKA